MSRNSFDSMNGFNRRTLDTVIQDCDPGKTRVVIDTCSLLHPGFEKAMDTLVPVLRRKGMKLVVPYCVAGEVRRKMMQPGTDPDLAHRARVAIRFINSIDREGLLVMPRDRNENEFFADAVFLGQCAKLRLNYQVNVITQDVNLMHDITAQNMYRSAKECYQIRAWKISRDQSRLVSFIWSESLASMKNAGIHSSIGKLSGSSQGRLSEAV